VTLPIEATVGRAGRRRGDPVVRAALVVAVLLGLVAVFAPALAPHDPTTGELDAALQGPSREHWLGTDHLGRDELSRLLFGARISLLAGFEVVAVAVLIGLPIGLVAGYRRGWCDRILMRVVEVVVAIPVLVVAIAVVAATGPGVARSMLAVGLVGATIMARVTRTLVLSAREEDYLDGAQITGASGRRIVARHLLPNILPSVAVQATLLLAAGVLAEAAVSFFGLGAVPPQPSWGIMLSQARGVVDEAPLLAVWPGACLFLTILAFNQLGDRTQDRLRGGASGAFDDAPIETVASPGPPRAERRAAALTLSHVTVAFPTAAGSRAVVADVSLDLAPGEVLALVGESGAGKSTLSLAALGLVPSPGRVRAASIEVAGIELVGAPARERRRVRGRHIGYVAQEPAASLDPLYPVGQQIAEPLRWHLGRSRRQAAAEAGEWLERVGIAAGRVRDRPHQFSGGEVQRIALAMALACRPSVLVADEPTTALDTVAQAQVLDLLLDARDAAGLAVLLVSHDLGVVAGVADRVAVMRRGRIVEVQDAATLFAQPRHPYTQSLLEASVAIHVPTDAPTRGPHVLSGGGAE
jgi:peptide/nickel transport system permease protein